MTGLRYMYSLSGSVALREGGVILPVEIKNRDNNIGGSLLSQETVAKTMEGGGHA